MSELRPKISIVTINYNHKAGLEQTIRSVIEQTYDHIEYIVIDGGSKDGSAEVIEKYADQVQHWVSEPDGGIYDAMNKGALAATGDWVNFMNSGDVFAATDVVAFFAPKMSEEIDLIYGHSIGVHEDGTEVFRGGGDPTLIWKSGQIRHNALFARTHLMREHPFSTDASLKVVADFDFMYKMYCLEKSYQRVDKTVLKYEIDGVSSQRSKWQEIQDVYKIHVRHKDLRPVSYRFHLWKLWRWAKNTSRNNLIKLLKGKS